MLDYLEENLLGLLSLTISLYIFFSNRKILWRNYKLNRDGARSETVELIFVKSQQKQEQIILKLALFNPGNIAAFINSFTVYKLAPHPINLLRYLGIRKWMKIEEARWWPSCDNEADSIKTLKNEYVNLYVEDYRNIFVNLPGYISREDYKFLVKTNHGSVERITNIDSTEIYFADSYQRWFLDS